MDFFQSGQEEIVCSKDLLLLKAPQNMENSNLSLKYTCETIQVLESMHIWKATKYLEDIILQKDVFHRQSIVELKDSKAKISAEFWLHKLKHVESDAESQ